MEMHQNESRPMSMHLCLRNGSADSERAEMSGWNGRGGILQNVRERETEMKRRRAGKEERLEGGGGKSNVDGGQKEVN